MEDQLDRLRQEASTGDPVVYLRRFEDFLKSLPEHANGVIRFRVKANIGHRYLALGDAANASEWLDQAFNEAPTDPRAVANKALGLWIGGKPREAHEYGRLRLAEDPTNEALASYLPQIAVLLPEIEHWSEGIPSELHSREMVRVSEIVFLRGRDRTPQWWDRANAALEQFPESQQLKTLKAFAVLDEITRDPEVQRSYCPTENQRAQLEAAAKILDAYWSDGTTALRSKFDDRSHALTFAMIAYQLLQEHEKAIARATRIADEGFTEPAFLGNAVQVALANGRLELARRFIELLPGDSELAFHGGVIAVQENDWPLAEQRFRCATVPERERALVDTVLRIAKIKRHAEDAPSLEAVFEAALNDARSLVLVSRTCSELGASEIANRAYRKALTLVGPTSHQASRLMVAALAEEIGSPSEIIELLDGHPPFHGYRREHAALARSHANERPHRERNIAYFNGLPEAVRSRPEISLAHASVLLDIGQASPALSILRRLYSQSEKKDAFVLLRLVEALRQTKDRRGAQAVLRSLDVINLTGTPAHAMAIIHMIAVEGEPERAYPAAYELVRKYPDRPDIALGYCGLGLQLLDDNASFVKTVVERDACVTIEGPGPGRTFVIDEGPEFYGISVESPAGPLAKLVQGKQVGDQFEISKMVGENETWKITQVISKYLFLQHLIFEQFEIRYPGARGLSRFTTDENDASKTLDLVRQVAETNRRLAQPYLDGKVPLGLIARMLGGDPLNFAHYVRNLGSDIVTCIGTAEERDAAIALAMKSRNCGATLDPYTACIAAEMNLLPTLKSWFGTLHIPNCALDMINDLITREQIAIGKEQMTIAWHDGQFFRQVVDDDARRANINALEEIRAKIVADGELQSVVLPNSISEETTEMLKMGDVHYLDAAYLAQQKNVPLLSDDMLYRILAKETAGCDGLWLQGILMASNREQQITTAEYARVTAELAARHHSHVALTAPVLYEICSCDDTSLTRTKLTLRYFAGPVCRHARAFDRCRVLCTNALVRRI